MNWQEAILGKFGPKRDNQQIVLAVDPDDLMRDDNLIAALLAQNYDILPLQNEVDFRFTFERDYRQHWDSGEKRHLIVIVHAGNGAGYIPYDIYQKSNRIELSVSELFPRLNAIIARELDNSYYGELYPAHQANLMQDHHSGQRIERLSERETIEFILRTVFGLDPLAIHPEQLIALLIRKHYSRHSLPSALETYLIESILPRGESLGMMRKHVQDSAYFYEWLEDQWRDYVRALLAREMPDVDFSRPELRLLVDNLFMDGLMPRLELSSGTSLSDLPADQQWASIGLTSPRIERGFLPSAIAESSADSVYALNVLLKTIAETDTTGYSLRDWLDAAGQWAEAVYMANTLSVTDYDSIREMFFTTRAHLNRAFLEFVGGKYNSISFFDDNQGPISLAKANHWLAMRHSKTDRVALVCFDGLALDQWLMLRNYLASQLPDVKFTEGRTFAIAPTLTPISRQALFAGGLPQDFADSIQRTDKDADRWDSFWRNREIPERRIAYLRVTAAGQGNELLKATLDSNNRRLGIVVNLFDDVMHGTKGMTAESDKRVFYQALAGQLDNSRLVELFNSLFTAGYHVYLTSDHGNVAGAGNGVKPPKALVEKFARRVAVYDSESLAEDFAKEHGLLRFRTKFLPENVHPVYARDSNMLDAANNVSVSHGGLSIEEMIVPLVKLELR